MQRPGGYTGPPSGGYQDLRGYHDPGDDRSGYMSDRGGYSSDRGGYVTDQRGYNTNRGGYANNRGGGYPNDRGGFVSDRGGYSSDRGGYNSIGDRGGFNSSGDRGGYRGWSRVERPEGQQRSGAETTVSTSGPPITSAASPKGVQGETSRATTSVQFSAKPDAAVESSPTIGAGATGSLPKSILRTTTTTPTTSVAMEATDGSLSDSQLGNSIHNLHKRPNPGMGKKSSSTSQLSDTGRQRRLGLIGQKRTTITVHRSEEVIPAEVRHGLVRQGTSISSDGEPELFPDNVSESWLVGKPKNIFSGSTYFDNFRPQPHARANCLSSLRGWAQASWLEDKSSAVRFWATSSSACVIREETSRSRSFGLAGCKARQEARCYRRPG